MMDYRSHIVATRDLTEGKRYKKKRQNMISEGIIIGKERG
jgi:hypothetical protein